MDKSFRVGWVEECWRWRKPAIGTAFPFAKRSVGEASRREGKETTQHFQGVGVLVGLSPDGDAALVLRATQPTNFPRFKTFVRQAGNQE